MASLAAASIDKDGVDMPYALVRRAGDFAYTAGIFDLGGQDARQPFGELGVKTQTSAIYRQLQDLLVASGTSLENTVHLLQFFRGNEHAAGYIDQRQRYFEGPLPASTGISVTGLVSPHAVVQVEALVAIPRPGMEVRPVLNPKSPVNTRSGYSQAMAFGDWIFCAGATASDSQGAAPYPGGVGTGIAANARVDPNYWSGSAVRSELRYIMEDKLAPILDTAGSTLQDIVHAHVYLLNPAQDYPWFREAWANFFPNEPPVTIVSPCAGLGAVGARIEVTPIAIRSDSRLPNMQISPPELPNVFAPFPIARRVGDLVFIGKQVAADESGILASAQPNPRLPHFHSQAELEMRHILHRLGSICYASGGHVSDLVAAHLYSSDLNALPAAIHEWSNAFDSKMVASIVEVSGTDWLPGCLLSFDGVAHIPLEGRAAGPVRRVNETAGGAGDDE